MRLARRGRGGTGSQGSTSFGENCHHVDENDAHNCTQADEEDDEEGWLTQSQGHDSNYLLPTGRPDLRTRH
jgi:hypothetical protein